MSDIDFDDDTIKEQPQQQKVEADSEASREAPVSYYKSCRMVKLPNGFVEKKKVTRADGQEKKVHVQKIGDKEVVSTVTKNLKTGQEEAKKELHNLAEDQAAAFEKEVEAVKSNWKFDAKPKAIAEKKEETAEEKK